MLPRLQCFSSLHQIDDVCLVDSLIRLTGGEYDGLSNSIIGPEGHLLAQLMGASDSSRPIFPADPPSDVDTPARRSETENLLVLDVA